MPIDRLHTSETPPVDFDHSLSDWREGKLSSRKFLKHVLHRVYSRHYYGDRSRSLKIIDVDYNEISEAAKNSETYQGSYEDGYAARNPRHSLVLSHYFDGLRSFGAINNKYRFTDSGKINNSNTTEFKDFGVGDERIVSPFVLENFLASFSEKSYKAGNEMFKVNEIKHAVNEAIPDKNKMANHVKIWLLKESLVSTISKMQIDVLMPLTKDQIEGSNDQVGFPGDQLFIRLSALSYLEGAYDRARESRDETIHTLPKFLKSKMNRNTVLAALFIKNTQNRNYVLEKVLRSIYTTGESIEARKLLAKICANAIKKGDPMPLEDWKINEIKLKPLIQEVLENPDEVVEVSEDNGLNTTELNHDLAVDLEAADHESEIQQTNESDQSQPQLPSKYPEMDEKYKIERLYPDQWGEWNFKKFIGDLIRRKEPLPPTDFFPTNITLPDEMEPLLDKVKSEYSGSPRRVMQVIGNKDGKVKQLSRLTSDQENFEFTTIGAIIKTPHIEKVGGIIKFLNFGHDHLHPEYFSPADIYDFLTQGESSLFLINTSEFGDYMLIRTGETKQTLDNTLYNDKRSFKRYWENSAHISTHESVKAPEVQTMNRLYRELAQSYGFLVYKRNIHGEFIRL